MPQLLDTDTDLNRAFGDRVRKVAPPGDHLWRRRRCPVLECRPQPAQQLISRLIQLRGAIRRPRQIDTDSADRLRS